MHCREVKRRIDHGVEITGEMRRHIQTCSECQRAVQAMNLLQEMFEAAKVETPALSLQTLQKNSQAGRNSMTLWEIIMFKIHYQWQSRPALWATGAVIVALLSFVAFVPFSYTQTVGYTVSVAGLGERLGATPELLNAAMTASGFDDLTVSTSIDGGVESFVFAPIGSAAEAHELAGALAGLTEAETEPKIEPIQRRASGTLLAQATQRKVVDNDPPARIRFDNKRIIINGERLDGVIFSADSSDAAVEQVIETIWKRLESETLRLSVDVKTTDDSTYRMVTIEVDPNDAEPGAKPVRVYLDDSEIAATWDKDVFVEKLGRLIEMQFPGRDDTMMAGSVILKVKLRD